MRTNQLNEEEINVLKEIIRTTYKEEEICLGIENVFDPDRIFFVNGRCLGCLGSRIALLRDGVTRFYELSTVKKIDFYRPQQE